MSWERDPLWAKAKLFLQRGFDEPRESPTFGLWCSLGLELLGRAAIASISPTLLAEADHNHKHLLYALNRGGGTTPPKSIAAFLVYNLCQTLYPEFTDDDVKASNALTNCRNEELHSGGAGFAEYPANHWLAGFYKACGSLCAAMGHTLADLFGEEEAEVATEILTKNAKDVQKRVRSAIASHRNVFLDKPKEERVAAAQRADEAGKQLATRRHHRVPCPACECVAEVQGREFGKEHVSHSEGEIVVRRAVAPNRFSCPACGLRLDGYAELAVAGLGGHYQRTTTYSPEDYFGLISPDELESHIQGRLSNMREYDNED